MLGTRLYRLLLLAVAIACIGPAGVGGATNADFNFEIVAVDLAGRQTNLTRNPAFDGSPSVSRDGRIAFVSTRGGNADLYVMNPNGGSVYRVTNSASDASGVAWDEALHLTQPSWSPQGDQIAFDRRYMERGAECMRLCANWRVLVVSSLGGGPVWSPAGGEVAFQGRRTEDSRTSIYVVRTDGRRRHRLAVGGSPSWSADGRRLAFIDSAGRLITMTRDGKRKRRVSRRGESVVAAAWSPRGGAIAFVAGTPNPYGGLPRDLRLETVRADGKRLRVLARPRGSSLTGYRPIWTPNGRRILVTVESR